MSFSHDLVCMVRHRSLHLCCCWAAHSEHTALIGVRCPDASDAPLALVTPPQTFVPLDMPRIPGNARVLFACSAQKKGALSIINASHQTLGPHAQYPPVSNDLPSHSWRSLEAKWFVKEFLWKRMFSLFVLCLMAELIAIAAQGVRIACMLPCIPEATASVAQRCICNVKFRHIRFASSQTFQLSRQLQGS